MVRVKMGKPGPWRLVGRAPIDSGRLWVGDPCYVLPSAGVGTERTYEAYSEGLNRAQFPDACEPLRGPFGMPLGVSVSTGLGDGVYDVEIRKVRLTYYEGRKVVRREDRVAEVRVRFLCEEE